MCQKLFRYKNFININCLSIEENDYLLLKCNCKLKEGEGFVLDIFKVDRAILTGATLLTLFVSYCTLANGQIHAHSKFLKLY